jgi:CheY-like chemotaxis protein
VTDYQSQTPGTGARILIVDDERKNRQLVEVILGAEGYQLESAASGDEALAIVAARPPDLVLLDVMMPGMDGYKVAAKLKGNDATRHIPVVLLSALTDQNSQTHGLNIGADAFLAKPVNRAELTALMEKLLPKGSA